MSAQTATPLAVSLASILLKSPGLDQSQIHIALARRGEFPGHKAVNHTLHGNRALFARRGAGRRRWYFVGHVPAAPRLYAWQLRAIGHWREAGRRGLIEAPAGAGKTLVGVQAIRDATARGQKCLVLVPGLEALTHWREALHRYAPGLRVGLAGGRESATLCRNQVIVATVHSGFTYPAHNLDRTGLLVVDDMHLIAPERLAYALDDRFGDRLGLTTALGHDSRTIDHLVPFFAPHGRPMTRRGAVVMTYGYAEAVADAVLMPWRVGFVGVRLATHERVEYEALDRIVSDARVALVELCNLPGEGGSEFARAVHALSEDLSGASHAHWLARRYLAAQAKRRMLLAQSPRKLAALERALPLMQRADGTLLFTEGADYAEMAALELTLRGLAAAALTPSLESEERRDLLVQYRSAQVRALVAPQDLDDGADLPMAELGVFVTPARTRRHLLARMGRVIGTRRGDGVATFIVLYFVNTVEDPEVQVAEEHAAGLPPVLLTAAQSVQVFGPYASADALLAWQGRTLTLNSVLSSVRG